MQFGWCGLYALTQPVTPLYVRSGASRFMTLISNITAQRRFALFLCCWLAWTVVFLRLKRRLQPEERP